MDDLFNGIRNLLELGTDLYWTTGLIIFIGGLVLFFVEMAGGLFRKRQGPQQVRVMKVEATHLHLHLKETSAYSGSVPPVNPERPSVIEVSTRALPPSPSTHIENAIRLAQLHHGRQRDKSGAPYCDHLQRVADRLETDTERTVAWLHDIIEDTHVTSADLKGAGFPDEIVEAVVALTKRGGEAYQDFVRRAGAHPLARRVKLADLADNMDEGRLTKLPEEKAARLRAKYSKARDLLLSPPSARSLDS